MCFFGIQNMIVDKDFTWIGLRGKIEEFDLFYKQTINCIDSLPISIYKFHILIFINESSYKLKIFIRTKLLYLFQFTTHII